MTDVLGEIKDQVSEYPEWSRIRLVLATPDVVDGRAQWGESDAEEIERHINDWKEREGKLRAKLTEIARGDIVQIVDETHGWFPCLLVVDEVKSWGVVAYVPIPHSNDGSVEVGMAYNRLGWEKIEKVGAATIVSLD